MTFFRRSRIGSLATALVLLLHLSPPSLSAQSPGATRPATWLYDLVPVDLPGEMSTRLGGINNQNEFMIVDDDSNGTIEGAFFDVAQMIVP